MTFGVKDDMKISVTIGVLLITTLFVASGHADDQPKAQNTVIQTGIASSNALTTLTAILKLVPHNDTILDIRFTSPTNIEVRLCGEDARHGCTRRYEKIDGEWKLGIIAKWSSEQSVPGYPPQGVGSPDP